MDKLPGVPIGVNLFYEKVRKDGCCAIVFSPDAEQTVTASGKSNRLSSSLGNQQIQLPSGAVCKIGMNIYTPIVAGMEPPPAHD